jgi:hypothetical protein
VEAGHLSKESSFGSTPSFAEASAVAKALADETEDRTADTRPPGTLGAPHLGPLPGGEERAMACRWFAAGCRADAVAGFSRLVGSTESRPTGKWGRPSPWSSPGGRGKSNGRLLVNGWLGGEGSRGFFENRGLDALLRQDFRRRQGFGGQATYRQIGAALTLVLSRGERKEQWPVVGLRLVVGPMQSRVFRD